MSGPRIITSLLVALLVSLAGPAVASERADQGKSVATELLEHSDPAVRGAALITVGHSGGAQERRELENYRSDDDPTVRLHAGFASMVAGQRGAQAFTVDQIRSHRRPYEALLRASVVLSEEQVVALINGLLTEAEAPLRRDVLRFVASRSGNIYSILTTQLQSSDEEIRRAAMQALRFSPRGESLGVAKSLASHRDVAVRAQALQITEALGDRRALRAEITEILIARLVDRDGSIQDQAARQLVSLNHRQGTEHLVGRLATMESGERHTTIGFLLEHDIRVNIQQVRPLIEALEVDEANRQEERELLYALAATSRDEDFFREATQKFNSSIFEDRLVAAKALGRSGNPEAVEFLTRGLFEGQTVMRLYSAQGLGHLGETEALTAMRRALNDRDREVRLAVIDSLGMIRDEQSTQVLRLVMGEQDPVFQERLVQSLDRLRIEEATRGLEMLLRGRNLDVQWKAFLALARVNPEVAIRNVNSALRNPPDTFAIDLNPSEMSAELTEAVYRQLLTHSSSRVRGAAVQHVSKYRVELLPVIRELVVSGDLTREIRQALVEVLLAIESDEDLARLDRVMRNFSGEFSGELAAWYLAGRDASSFEASFRGFMARDASVMQAIAAYALTRM